MAETMNITVTIGGKEKEYELRMTRASLRKAEEIGLDILQMEKHPVTQSTYLFMAALWGGGTNCSANKAMEISDAFFDTDESADALEKLANMYADVFHTRG